MLRKKLYRPIGASHDCIRRLLQLLWYGQQYESGSTIEAIYAKYGNDVVVYNLNGRPVTAGKLKKGIYVVNGHKVVVR